MSAQRIYLSPPDVGERERELLLAAFDSGWIAPLGPHVDAFEREVADLVGVSAGAALCSGTAALHLALRLLGIGEGDEVVVSDLTFVATANPVVYQRAVPVFVGAESSSWNMDPNALEDLLERKASKGRLPAAIVVAHLYGQTSDMTAISTIARRFDVPVIEDAAEAIGSTCGGRNAGAFGLLSIFSFNGNKIITTSGGGMLVSDDDGLIARARKLATQAREPAAHYEHAELGFNYRLSNLLAAVGRAQLEDLENKVARCRNNFEHYSRGLSDLPVRFQEEAQWGRHTRWLTTLVFEGVDAAAHRDAVLESMAAANIEARPLWKPMHLQPLYRDHECVAPTVGADLFARGLCLPSGANLTESDRERVIAAFRAAL